jgi:hypothetical protein
MKTQLQKILTLVFLGLVVGACASTAERKTASQEESNIPKGGDARRTF